MAITISEESFADAYSNRGLANFNLGQYQSAIDDLDKALQLYGTGGYIAEYAAIYNNRGRAYFNLGQDKKAKDDLDWAILFPPYALGQTSVTSDYSFRDQHRRALEDYNEAIRLNPKYTEAYSNRALVYFNREQFELAIKDLDEVIRLDNQNAVAYNNRGVTYFRFLTQKSKAIQDYTEAIRLNPQFALAYRNRAEIHTLNGDTSLAEIDLRKAEELERLAYQR